MSKQLGFKIKTARRKLNISQGDLSKKLEISPSYLNLIESGKRKVSADLLIKASEILNLDLKKLSTDDNLNLVHDLQELLTSDTGTPFSNAIIFEASTTSGTNLSLEVKADFNLTKYCAISPSST